MHSSRVDAPEQQDAASLFPPLFTYVSDDVNVHAGNLPGWSQIYDQLSAGSFHGEITGIFLDTVHLFCESTSLRLRQTCLVHGSGLWFGIPSSSSASFCMNTHRIPNDRIVLRPCNVQFERVTPENFQIFGIICPVDVLREHMQNMDRPSLPLASLRAESLQVDESDLNRLRHLAQKMLSEACRTPAVLQSEASRRNMQNVLLNALVSIHCSSEKSGRITRGEIQHAKIVRSVRRYLLDHRDSMVGVPELCREFQISRRTLQYAFELVLGISPHTYLRMLRLNGVRRDLLKKGSTGLSVQNVAANWGFWHMSQFAKDYRSFFNELPSVTLKRRTGLCTAAIRQDFDLPQRRSRVPAAASGRQQRRGTPRSVA